MAPRLRYRNVRALLTVNLECHSSLVDTDYSRAVDPFSNVHSLAVQDRRRTRDSVNDTSESKLGRHALLGR